MRKGVGQYTATSPGARTATCARCAGATARMNWGSDRLKDR